MSSPHRPHVSRVTFHPFGSAQGRVSRFTPSAPLRAGFHVSRLFILLTAFALRVHALADVPPGLTHDEAGHGHDAAAVLEGFRPIYFTVGYGREPLYDYLNAGVFGLLGRSVFTLRLASVYWSMLLVALTYVWTRRNFGSRTALLTAALLAVSFWPLATARQALRSTALPTLFLLAIIAFHRIQDTGYRIHVSRFTFHVSRFTSHVSRFTFHAPRILAFALLLAAALYTYIPARVLWLLFPAALLVWKITSTQHPTRNTQHPIPNIQYPIPNTFPVLAALLLTAILSSPLFIYLRTHPGAEARLEMLDAPLQSLRQGDPGPILANARETVLSYFLPGHGDNFLAYNIPGRPFFDPLTALLFLAGLLICLRRIKQPAPAFALLWFGIGIAPALVTGPTASFTRSIAAQPVVYLFPAIALDTLRRWLIRNTQYAIRNTYHVLHNAAEPQPSFETTDYTDCTDEKEKGKNLWKSVKSVVKNSRG